MIAKLRLTALAGLAAVLVLACVPAVTSVSTNATASADANGGLPVKVTLYYLTSTAKFNSVDFFTLDSNPQAALGADLVKTSSVILSPGDTKPLSTTIDGEGPFSVGITAGFKNLASSQWRTSTGLKSGANMLTVQVGKGSVSVSK